MDNAKEEVFKEGDECYCVNDGLNGIHRPNGESKEVLVTIVNNSFFSQASGYCKEDDWDYIVKGENGYRRIIAKKAKLRLAKQKEVDLLNNFQLF